WPRPGPPAAAASPAGPRSTSPWRRSVVHPAGCTGAADKLPHLVAQGAPLDIFRRGLLEGQVVAIAPAGAIGAAVADACEALGALVDRHGDVAPDDAAAAAFAADVIARRGALHTLVVDAAAAFAAGAAEPAGSP